MVTGAQTETCYQHTSFFMLKNKISKAFRTNVIQGQEQPLHFYLQRCSSTSRWTYTRVLQGFGIKRICAGK